MIIRVLSVLLISPLLSACLGGDEEAPVSTIAAPPIVDEGNIENTESVIESAAPDLIENAPPPIPDPDDLLGLEPYQVVGRLGTPNFVRWDTPAQIYQYQGAGCILDVYFYEQGSGEPFFARYAEARTNTGDITDKTSCLQALLPGGFWPETVLP